MSLSSKSVSINSANHPKTFDFQIGKLFTFDGLRSLKYLSRQEKYTFAVCSLTAVAGVALTGFGVVENLGFLHGKKLSLLLSVASSTKLAQITISNWKYQKTLPELQERLCDQAMAFAREKLAGCIIEPTVFKAAWGAETHQPLSKEIQHLCTVHAQILNALKNELKKHKDPWSQPDVIIAADNLIKVGYAISRLTLEEIPGFIDSLKKIKGVDWTPAEALTDQTSYQYRTFYYCTMAYHNLRREASWVKLKNAYNIQITSEGSKKIPIERLVRKDNVSKNHSDLFYTKGTIQLRWRLLYNDYCDRIRKLVDEKELNKEDSRAVEWTQKDEGVATFKTPTECPT